MEEGRGASLNTEYNSGLNCRVLQYLLCGVVTASVVDWLKAPFALLESTQVIFPAHNCACCPGDLMFFAGLWALRKCGV